MLRVDVPADACCACIIGRGCELRRCLFPSSALCTALLARRNGEEACLEAAERSDKEATESCSDEGGAEGGTEGGGEGGVEIHVEAAGRCRQAHWVGKQTKGHSTEEDQGEKYAERPLSEELL